jgi:hypothetical protein
MPIDMPVGMAVEMPRYSGNQNQKSNNLRDKVVDVVTEGLTKRDATLQALNQGYAQLCSQMTDPDKF